MRTLFEMDARDYDPNGSAFVRPSVRGVILRNGTVAMVHSIKYDYYKFPGGGMEAGESQIQTLLREVQEESGLAVLPDPIREYGLVPRKQKSDRVGEYEIFVQENYYYLCDTSANVGKQALDDYEREEQFTLEWVKPEYAVAVNRNRDHGPKNQMMLEREARVLETLIRENYFGSEPEIRNAEPADYDRIEALMQQVHQLHLGWRPDIYKAAETIYPRAHFERLVAEKRILVAEHNGIVVGHLTFSYRHIASDKQVTRDVIFVDDLAVQEEYRGHGIGTKLLTAVKEKVRAEQLDGLELQVNARNTAAKRMYEKFGFTEKSINMELL